MTTILDRDSVALRAYYLWEAEGRPEGRHETHWIAAEAAEARSLKARRAAVTRKTNQAVKPKASAKTVVAAAALSGAKSTSKGSRRVH